MCKRIFLVMVFVAGCVPAVGGDPPREPATSALPATFGGTRAREEATPATTMQRTWRDVFDADELRVLVDAALDKNQELNGRLQEIIIAQNEVSAREGEYLPKVSGKATASVERVGKRTSQGVSDDAHGLPENLGNFGFGLVGSWEVDVWKRLRNAAKAADLRYRASIEGRNFLVTQIVAEIARSYYELLALDNSLEVLKRNIQVQEDALEVIRLQKQAARATELAVQRFEAEVLKNKSRQYVVEQERVQTENRINFLLGRYPQPVSRNAKRFRDPLPDAMQTGLPSQLLDNRPDVRQAALELEATKLDVKSARAAFFPSLAIDAGVGYRSFNAAHLVDTPDSVFFGLGATVTVPLLNRAAIQAQYQSASAHQIQAVLTYERTLLQAFTEVANQQAMIENLQKSYELRARQVEALERSSEAALMLFQSARADYMEVLLTRRDTLDAEMELIETRKRQLQAMVGIYQALGGGWRHP